jgi:hypothetical protein
MRSAEHRQLAARGTLRHPDNTTYLLSHCRPALSFVLFVFRFRELLFGHSDDHVSRRRRHRWRRRRIEDVKLLTAMDDDRHVRRRPSIRVQGGVENQATRLHLVFAGQRDLHVVAIDLLEDGSGHIALSVIFEHSNQGDWTDANDGSAAGQSSRTCTSTGNAKS